MEFACSKYQTGVGFLLLRLRWTPSLRTLFISHFPNDSSSILCLQEFGSVEWYNPTMPKPRPNKATKPKQPKPTGTLKIPGTFNQLIAKSLTVKKPAEGWPKAGKPS
jgi:hypothetical protein